MTKNNTALLAQLLTNTEISTNQTLVDFITSTLETAGQKGSAHPQYTDEATGLEMKWCIRHEKYELLTEWTVPNSGKLDASCDVAVGQWKEYTKQVKAAEKAVMNNTDATKAMELQTAWVLAKTLRAGKYNYPTEAVATQKEEATPVKPKRKAKK